MSDLFGYPYLTEATVLLLLALSTLWILPEHRRLLLLSATLLLPASLIAMHYVPAYWNPKVVGRYLVAPEDVIWTLSCGMTTWFLAILPFRHRVGQPGPVGSACLRIAVCYVTGAAAFVALRATLLPHPEHAMPATVLLMLAAGTIFGLRAPERLPLGVAGAAGYCMFHLADLWIGFRIWPESIEAFQPAAHLGPDVLGVPGWEIVWGASFGFAWPLVLATVVGIRLRASMSRRGSERREQHD